MKGNIIVGQSGGPTCVINSSLAGVFQTGKNMGCNKIYGMIHGIQGFLEGRYVDLSDHVKEAKDIELLKRTPASYLGSCRYKLPSIEEGTEVYKDIFKRLEDLDISYFFYIGGNDSMDTINKLNEYGQEINSSIRFMGVPKTVDNDLQITDHTPGYGSAAKFIATATLETSTDSKVYDREQVTILEIMGRNSGWLTAASAIAEYKGGSGPDLIYLPERVFDFDKLIEDIKEVRKRKKAIVIALSEGIHTKEGKYVSEMTSSHESVDEFGHVQLGGAGSYVANYITSTLGIRTRAIEFNTVQRSASHLASLVDINEAYQVGAAAVEAALNGETGKMVAIIRKPTNSYSSTFKTYDVNKIANFEKTLPDDYINQEGNYVTEEFIDYVTPLIQGELTPYMVDGIPRHLKAIEK